MSQWGVIENLIAGLVATALLYAGTRLWKWIRKQFIPIPKETPLAPGLVNETVPAPLVVAAGSVENKVAQVEQQRDEAVSKALEARSHGLDDREFNELEARVQEALRIMSFLAPEDILDGRYNLIAYLGGGRMSVVWKAYDRARDRSVAVKFLRHAFINDESVVRRFHYTARLMSEFGAASFAAVREDVREVMMDGRRKLVYYTLEFVDGEPLDVYLAKHPERRADVLDRMLELGRCLVDAHAKGVVHRDLKPPNILVEPNGTLKLVDFDAVLRLGDRSVTHHEVGTFGYSAPEILNGVADPDVRADIFALGRVFSYLYYGARHLPNAYELSVYDVIDLLNCAPVVKDTLERATAVRRARRYGSMKSFLEKLREAVTQDREHGLPPFQTLRRERAKVVKLLRHSFYGTLALMIVPRPICAAFGIVHLSDRAWVGAFHAIIGSLVWGTLIPGAFILYLVLFGRRLTSRWWQYLVASICCGLGGLFGGILVSVPSVFVTNDRTLACLGWLTSSSVTARLHTALIDTRMMLSFPLTGLFTGLGTGLCLYLGIEIALQSNPQGSGILPVPSKRSARAAQTGSGVLRHLLTSPGAHLALAVPVLFSFVVASSLHPADPSPLLACTALPNEPWRSVGEGVVHYFGALGLTIGFFRGILMMPASPR